MEFVKIIDSTGCWLTRKFKFNGHSYELSGTRTEDRLQSVWECVDCLSRDDGKHIEMPRWLMRDYFGGKLKDKEYLKRYAKVW
ncbi:hypothetical protein ACQ1PV_09255 [Ornithobacterium rhinotracheale]